MRAREKAALLAQDVLAGRHTSLHWWDELSIYIHEKSGSAVEKAPHIRDGEEITKLWITSLSRRECHELVFETADEPSLYRVGIDGRKALTIRSAGSWRETWLSIINALNGKNFFTQKYAGGSRRKLATRKQHKNR